DMNTSSTYLKYKEDNDLDIFHYISIENILDVGNPIDEDGIDMILESNELYTYFEGGEYRLLS
ncbi:hypothetical protein ABK046_44485, partial [Streptomyces caeruleatus]